MPNDHTDRYDARAIAERFPPIQMYAAWYCIPAVCHDSPERDLHIRNIGDRGNIATECHSNGCATKTIKQALGIWGSRTPTMLAFHAGVGNKGSIEGSANIQQIADKQRTPEFIKQTDAARAFLADGNKDAFNAIKDRLPWFMPNGWGRMPKDPNRVTKSGRGEEDVSGITGYCGFDWDNQPDPDNPERDNPMPPEAVNDLLSELRENPHVHWASRSVSGAGVKAVLSVNPNEPPPDASDISALHQWHARVWQAGVDILPAERWQDPSVKHLNRFFYISGDADVYTNPNAIPLDLDISTPEPVAEEVDSEPDSIGEPPDDADFGDELPELSDDGRMRVYTEHAELNPNVEFARLANEIVDMNMSDTPYPFLFLNSSLPPKLVEVNDGRIGEPLKIPGARRHLARIADFKGKGGKASIMPPGEYIAELIDNPPMAMPVVHHIQRAPMLVKDANGRFALYTHNGFVEYIDAMGEVRGAVMHGLPPDYPLCEYTARMAHFGISRNC